MVCTTQVGSLLVQYHSNNYQELFSAVVIEKLGKQCFKLKWADDSYQKQNLLHMFGSLTSRRVLHAGDHVLALAMPGEFRVCI